MNTVLKTIIPVAAICILAVACQKDNITPTDVVQQAENRGPTNIGAVGIPDLIVTKITTNLPVQLTPCSTTSPMPDATCTIPSLNGVIKVEITNIGSGAAVGGFDVQLPGVPSGTRTYATDLAPGATGTVSWTGFTWSQCTGTPFVKAYGAEADVNNSIPESNENNNISRRYNSSTT